MNQDTTSEQRSKYNNNTHQALKESKDLEKLYISQINIANEKRVFYIERAMQLLDQVQVLEEVYTDFVKDSLRKYMLYEVSKMRNIQYDIGKRGQVYDEISGIKDLRDFIRINARDNTSMPKKIEFQPYTVDTFIHKQEVNKEIIDRVNNYINNTFYRELPYTEVEL